MLNLNNYILQNQVLVENFGSWIHEAFGFFLVSVVFFPFFAFCFVFLFGSYLGDKGVSIFCFTVTFIGWLFSVIYLFVIFSFYFFYSFQFNSVEFCFGSWVSVSDFSVYWGFYFDPLAVIMIFTVLSVTLAVQFYCFDYMWGDPFFSKFYAYLALFSFFMLFLVSSNNYLQIFLGWEGVGLVSFLLISFWNTRKDAVGAGIKAMLINRIGDLFFILGMLVMASSYKTLNFNSLFEKVPFFSILDTEIFVFSLVIASMAKSAQLGLHTWLPDAMEGPTPVSALIHAATMVTAGIFVIIRSSPIIIESFAALEFMCLVGGLTALFGSTVAAVQFDIKKIIAYSTCSQLGYMLLACGCGNFAGAFFHLVTHAFFKALLFLSAGSVIHSVSNEQDIRKMGGLYNFLPFTYVCVFFGSLSLAGVPLFSGFYSKDFVLEYAYLQSTPFSILGYFLGLISVFFTAFYSFRLLYFVFFAPYAGTRCTSLNIEDAPFFMLVSMSFLLVPAVFFGFVFFDIFVGKFSNFIWIDSLSGSTNKVLSASDYIIENKIKQLPLIFCINGFLVSYMVNYLGMFRDFFSILAVKKAYSFLLYKWYFDNLYNFVVVGFMRYIYVYFWMTVERGVLVYIGPKFFKSIPGYFLWLKRVPQIRFGLSSFLVLLFISVTGLFILIAAYAFNKSVGPAGFAYFFLVSFLIYFYISTYKDQNKVKKLWTTTQINLMYIIFRNLQLRLLRE